MVSSEYKYGRSRSEQRSYQRKPLPSRSRSFDPAESKHSRAGHSEDDSERETRLKIFDASRRPKNCIEGPNIYGTLLGPTVDEQILAGLVALFRMCGECNQEPLRISDSDTEPSHHSVYETPEPSASEERSPRSSFPQEESKSESIGTAITDSVSRSIQSESLPPAKEESFDSAQTDVSNETQTTVSDSIQENVVNPEPVESLDSSETAAIEESRSHPSPIQSNIKSESGTLPERSIASVATAASLEKSSVSTNESVQTAGEPEKKDSEEVAVSTEHLPLEDKAESTEIETKVESLTGTTDCSQKLCSKCKSCQSPLIICVPPEEHRSTSHLESSKHTSQESSHHSKESNPHRSAYDEHSHRSNISHQSSHQNPSHHSGSHQSHHSEPSHHSGSHQSHHESHHSDPSHHSGSHQSHHESHHSSPSHHSGSHQSHHESHHSTPSHHSGSHQSHHGSHHSDPSHHSGSHHSQHGSPHSDPSHHSGSHHSQHSHSSQHSSRSHSSHQEPTHGSSHHVSSSTSSPHVSSVSTSHHTSSTNLSHPHDSFHLGTKKSNLKASSCSCHASTSTSSTTSSQSRIGKPALKIRKEDGCGCERNRDSETPGSRESSTICTCKPCCRATKADKKTDGCNCGRNQNSESSKSIETSATCTCSSGFKEAKIEKKSCGCNCARNGNKETGGGEFSTSCKCCSKLKAPVGKDCCCQYDTETTKESSVSCNIPTCPSAVLAVKRKCPPRKKTISCKCKTGCVQNSLIPKCACAKRVTICGCPHSTTSESSKTSTAEEQKQSCETQVEIRYAITKITKFSSYTTFEVLKSTRKKPKVMPTKLEGVFVLRNRKCN